MNKKDRRRMVTEMLQGTRKDMMRIADAMPDNFHGMHLRIAFIHVAERYDPQMLPRQHRGLRNEVQNFIYNHNL